MILQEEFRKSKYKDLLIGDIASQYGINLEDIFYIECMDCIGIDEDEWNIQEDCSSCIFSEKCINEET